MIRKVQTIGILFISLLIIVAGLARHYHRKDPIERRKDKGLNAFLFDCRLTENDYLAIRTEGPIGFLEAHFPDHTILRYEWPPYDSTAPRLSEWTDSTGRRKTRPVIVIRVALPAGSELIAPLGKDYLSKAGSMDETTRLDRITADCGLTSIQLSNYPFHRAPIRGTSAIELATEFKLQDIKQPTAIDSSHVQTDEYLCPSSDGLHLAVSSISGDLNYLESASGKPIWKFHVPDGRLGDIVMSEGNRFLFVGEHSADGNVYCIDAQTGRPTWKYATSADIGSYNDSLPDSSAWSESTKPNVRDLIGRNSILFVRSRRSRITLENGRRVKSVISKLLAFHQDNGGSFGHIRRPVP
jgi:hypothetical protein